MAQKPVPIVPPPAAASGRPAEAGSRIAADSQAVNTAKAAAFRRPSIASAAQLAAGRHRQASGVFRGFRLQQPAAAGLPVPSHHQVAHGPVADRSCSWFNSTPWYRLSTSVSTSHVGLICLWATFSSLDWRYLAFKGLIRVPWDIYPGVSGGWWPSMNASRTAWFQWRLALNTLGIAFRHPPET